MRELQEVQTELKSSGLDEPELMRHVRRLHQWWKHLGFVFQVYDVNMVLSDQRHPPPDYYFDILKAAKEPVSNTLIVTSRLVSSGTS